MLNILNYSNEKIIITSITVSKWHADIYTYNYLKWDGIVCLFGNVNCKYVSSKYFLHYPYLI